MASHPRRSKSLTMMLKLGWGRGTSCPRQARSLAAERPTGGSTRRHSLKHDLAPFHIATRPRPGVACGPRGPLPRVTRFRVGRRMLQRLTARAFNLGSDVFAVEAEEDFTSALCGSGCIYRTYSGTSRKRPADLITWPSKSSCHNAFELPAFQHDRRTGQARPRCRTPTTVRLRD
jgi:hypothetical protein